MEKIVFIIKDTQDAYLANALDSLANIKTAGRYSLEYILLSPAEYVPARFNELLATVQADYYVYLQPQCCIVKPDFCDDFIAASNADERLEAAGVWGTQSLPTNGNILSSCYQVGRFLRLVNGSFELFSGDSDDATESADTLRTVKYIVPYIMITRGRVRWEARYTSEYVASLDYAERVRAAGLTLGVLLPAEPGIAIQCEELSLAVSQGELMEFLPQMPSWYTGYDDYLYSYGGENELWGGRFICPEAISIGAGNVIQQDAYFQIPFLNFDGTPRIKIGSNCEIGARCTISAANSVVVEDYVLMAANIHISDHNHAYQDILKPILRQGPDSWTNSVTIGYGSWLANNVTVVGNLRIGRGCVIGTNSYVNTDIPDYCVAVGSPAKVVKGYSFTESKWVKISSVADYRQFLAERERFLKNYKADVGD